MTFDEWFNKVEDEDECSVSEIVWHCGPHKGRDVADLLREAYEAGHKKGFEQGDYLEGWDEGYKAGKKTYDQ